MSATDYAAVVNADSPYAYWKLNESSGTAAADSASTHSGAYSGGFTLGQQWPGRDLGVAFDGSSGQMAVPSTTGINWGTFPMSLECWYYLAALPGDADPRPFVVPGFSGAHDLGHGIGLNLDGANSGKIQFGYYSALVSSWKVCTYATSPALNQWHHALGTYDGTTMKLYHDGVMQSSTSPSPGLSTVDQSPLYFGRRWDTSGTHNFTAVTLAQAAYYLAALSQARVTAHYQAGLPVGPISSPRPALMRASTR